ENFIQSFEDILEGTNILTEERKKFIRKGIENYTEGRYLESIYILAFQIEPLMLDIFEFIKIPIYSINAGEMQTRMFGDIVQTLKSIEGIDTSFTFFLQYFYCDKK